MSRSAAEDRLRRLLVMLPWLMERGEVPLAEVASRFEMSEADVVRELELVAMCGLPPFVDELVDVFVDEGSVFVGVPRLFTRPLRLNAREAFELLAAGRAAMELPGADPDGPLGRGLGKLAAALEDPARGSGVEVDLDRPEGLDELVAATSSRARLRLRYLSAAGDELTERTVTPYQVSTDRGFWYLTAHDDRSGSVRVFRVDRIASFEPTGDHGAEPDEPLPEPGRWFDDGSVTRATLRLDARARWVVERYPVDDVTDEPDGSLTVRLAVASERWLERLLLRLGPDAEVVEPASLRGVGADAAGRVLARYRRS